MSNVEDINKNQPHFNVMAVCLECFNKWIGTIPEGTPVFKLQCPSCEKQNSFASFIPSEYK